MKTDCNSTRFLMAIAADLAQPLPEPPQRLEPHALKFWKPTIESKRRAAWTESDLLTACQLCRDLAALETLSEEIEVHGWTFETDKGRTANPAARLLDAASKRVMRAQTHLQIHSLGTNGKTDHQARKNETSRDLQSKLSEASNLIARPNLQ